MCRQSEAEAGTFLAKDRRRVPSGASITPWETFPQKNGAIHRAGCPPVNDDRGR